MRLTRAFISIITSILIPLLPFIFFLSPTILRRYPGPYTTPLADVLAWLGDKITQGAVSVLFCMALVLGYRLAYDAYRCLTGATTPASATPCLTELEEGTATIPEGQPAAVEENADGTPSPAPEPSSSEKTPILAKIGMLLFLSVLLPPLFFINGIISSSKSFMENVGAVLLYFLHGSQVIFVIWCLGFVVVRVLRYLGYVPSTAVAPTQAAPEVLFEGTLPEENENAEKQTEKA